MGLRIVGLQTSQFVVFAFARAAEAKSPYTQGHAQHVTEYALALATQIGLTASENDVLQRAGACSTTSARSVFPTPSSTSRAS